MFQQQESYINASQSNLLQEMAGLIDGVCSPPDAAAGLSAVPKECSDPAALLKTIQQVILITLITLIILVNIVVYTLKIKYKPHNYNPNNPVRCR